MTNIKVKISGPGLVVNYPVALIIKALRQAGFSLSIPEFGGKHQYVKDRENWENITILHGEEDDRIHSNQRHATLEVDAQPWGG